MRPLSANAQHVLAARYLRRDATGRPLEDFEGLCARVADAVAQAEAAFGGRPEVVSERFEALLRERVFLPNSPTLMNAGTASGQLAACFVLPVGDTLESIFEATDREDLVSVYLDGEYPQDSTRIELGEQGTWNRLSLGLMSTRRL